MELPQILQLIILIFLLVFSAFFSMSETALTTCNRIRVRSLADEGNKRAGILLKIWDDPKKMLSAILIGNNIVNISASSLATILAVKIFGSMGAGIATGTLTVLILIFGEISPKTIATLYAQSISLAIAPFILFLMKILTPVIFIINLLANGFMKLIHIDPNKKNAVITEEELRTLVDVSHEEGVIEKDEQKMINNVVDFGDARAKDIMVPRVDVTMIEASCSYKELMDIFREERFTRLPVYENDKSNVVGILNMKDILLVEDPDQFKVSDYMRSVDYTYENKKLSEMLAQMRESCRNVTIVVNEYGDAVGLVTLEDLLEEIVGEIRDEYDEEEVELIKKVSDKEYIIEGSMKLDDINERLGLDLDSEDYDSIGGLVIQQLDRLPKQGDTVTCQNVKLIVLKMDRNRIEKVRMIILKQEEEQE